MIHALDASLHAVSSKVLATAAAAGFILADVTNPIIAVTASLVGIGACIGLFTKAYRWLGKRSANEDRLALMLDGYFGDGTDEHPGIPDQLADIRAALADLRNP